MMYQEEDVESSLDEEEEQLVGESLFINLYGSALSVLSDHDGDKDKSQNKLKHEEQGRQQNREGKGEEEAKLSQEHHMFHSDTSSRPPSPPPPPPPQEPISTLPQQEGMKERKKVEKRPFLKKGSRNWNRVEAVKQSKQGHLAEKSKKESEKEINSELKYQRNNELFDDSVYVKVTRKKDTASRGDREALERMVFAERDDFWTLFDKEKPAREETSAWKRNESEDVGERQDFWELYGGEGLMKDNFGLSLRESRYSSLEEEDDEREREERLHVEEDTYVDEAMIEEDLDDDCGGYAHPEDERDDEEGMAAKNDNKPVSKLVEKMFYTLDAREQNRDLDKDESIQTKVIHSEENKARRGESDTDVLSQQLMEEMKKFQEGNERLAESLRTLEVDRKRLETERMQLDKEKRQQSKQESEEMRSLREEVRKERAQLHKERVALERQKQHIDLMRASAKLEKKDKAQVESLQATIAQLKQTEQERTARHKEVVRGKQERIAALETQVGKLEEALKFAESRRLDIWERERQAQAQLEQVTAKFHALQEQFNSFVENMQAERLQNKEPAEEPSGESEGEQRDEVARPEQVGKRKNNDSRSGHKRKEEAGKSRRKRSGKRVDKHVEMRSDGTRVTTLRNGTVKEIHPSGETTVSFTNGDIRKIVPSEGIEVYYFADRDTTQTTYKDGVVVVEFSDGQLERTLTDGTVEVFYPDGTLHSVFPDGTEETLFSDGTKIIQSTDGTKRVFDAGSAARAIDHLAE